MTLLTEAELTAARGIAQLLVGLPQDIIVDCHRRVVIERAARLMLARWEPDPAFRRAMLLGDRVIDEIARQRLEIEVH